MGYTDKGLRKNFLLHIRTYVVTIVNLTKYCIAMLEDELVLLQDFTVGGALYKTIPVHLYFISP